MQVELRTVCALAVIASALAGCATHPLPENYPLNFQRSSTFDIVQTVRCELKAGIERAKSGARLAHSDEIVKATYVGYHFTFKMTEENDLIGGSLTLVGSAKKGAGKLDRTVDLTGSAKRHRVNERRFSIVEPLLAVEKADCGRNGHYASLSYPISGTLRLDDLAFSYLQMELTTNLDAFEPPPGTAVGGKNGVLSEVISFKTSVRLGAVPTLKLAVSPGSFGVKSGTASGVVRRFDEHDLIIVFAQDPNLHSAEVRAAVAERDALLARRQIGRAEKKVIRAARLETVLAQANANAKNKVLFEIARLRNLLDDEQERSRFIGERLLTFLRPPDEIRPGD